MTGPFNAGPQQPRMANGYVQLPGGYGSPPPGAAAPQQYQQQPTAAYPPQQPSMLPQGLQEGFSPDLLPIPARIQAQPIVPPVGVQPTQQPPQQQPQQFQQPVPQQPAPQQVGPAPIDPGARLYGPSVPPNLQGRTFAEAMQIYNGMQNVVLQQLHGQAPQQQAPAPQQQAPVPAAPGAPAPAGWDWRNPEASVQRAVGPAIQDAIAPVLAAISPIVQQSNIAAVSRARDAAAAQIGPAFAQIEQHVIQRLAGADPRALMNPEAWRIAATSVLGEFSLRNQSPLPQQPLQQLPQAPGHYQPQAQPMPNLNTFYTEQPNVGAPQQGIVQLTPQQDWAARQMGMSAADYLAWGGMAVRR